MKSFIGTYINTLKEKIHFQQEKMLSLDHDFLRGRHIILETFFIGNIQSS